MAPRRTLGLGAAAIALLASATACGGTTLSADQASSTAVQASTTTASISSGPATTVAASATSDAQQIDAASAVGGAVEALVAADGYQFEAMITIVHQGETVEIELEGWVDGSDRELAMRAGGNEVITRVIDGIATVEHDGEVIEVPLEEAGTPPSIEILKSIQRAKYVSQTKVAGRLNASDLKASGFDAVGAAEVVVYLGPDNSLIGYDLELTSGGWSAEVRFAPLG